MFTWDPRILATVSYTMGVERRLFALENTFAEVIVEKCITTEYFKAFKNKNLSKIYNITVFSYNYELFEQFQKEKIKFLFDNNIEILTKKELFYGGHLFKQLTKSKVKKVKH